MKIRQARSIDIDDIAYVISTAFLVSDYQSLKESIVDNPRYSYKDIIVVEESEEVIACMKIMPLKVSFKGKIINTAGISGVAVLPEHRKKGVADIMLKDALRKMFEAKYPFSILYPFQHRFYRKYGWEYVGAVMFYEIEPSNIQLFDERLKVRKMKNNEREKIKEVYAEKIKSLNFALWRNDAFWTRVVFPNFSNPYVYDDGEIKGYISFEMKKNENAQIEVYIKELVALTPDSYRGLWGFLSSLSEQVSKIKYLAPLDEPIFDILVEPREKNFKRPFFEFKSYASTCSGFMMRVVNLEEALSLFTVTDLIKGEATIQISDPLLPENNFTFKITAENGKLHIQKTNKEADIKTDIATFSQIISGFSKPSSLHQIGRIKGNKETLRFLDLVFVDFPPFMFQFDIF